MALYPVILSGGAGTRLWPLSSGNHPKQFLSLVSEKTMIQETLLRLDGIETQEPIVCCNESHRFLVAEQLQEVSSKKASIILEPCPKNTAPAIAAACMEAMSRSKDAVVAVFPSDHVIEDKEAFVKAVKTAVINAQKGNLVTFGIVPSFAATGYGYVKAGSTEEDGAYKLENFVEKPCLEKAQEYLDSGLYAWNSGMFVFKAESFLSELKAFNPKMYELVELSYKNAQRDSDFTRLDKESFSQIAGDSIDYAVMEKTSKGKIVKLNAGWNDVGSWSALYDIQKKDENANVIKANAITINTKNTYINAKNHLIATIGVENLVIVESDNEILIANKDCVQDVKKIAEQLSKK